MAWTNNLFWLYLEFIPWIKNLFFLSFTLQLFADIVEISVTFLQIWQEGLLQEEIQKLKDEINDLTNYIESRKSESSKLEETLAKRHNDYNDLRKQRDVLQEERKYVNFFWMVMALPLNGWCVALNFIYLVEGKFCRSYWKEESEVTAELDRLQEDLIKAQKSLDQATPGVLNSTSLLF